MTLVPEYTIDMIRERTNVRDIVGGYVDLKKRGKDHYGICPFCEGSSFSVSPKGFFKCFVCGEGGDAIKFLTLKGMPFRDAVVYLGGLCGIDVDADVKPPPDYDPKRSERERERAEAAHRERQEAAWAKIATKLAERFRRAEPARDDHPYLVSKGITSAPGLKQEGNTLLVPMRAVETDKPLLMSIQKITTSGAKMFAEGGRTGGTRTVIGAKGFKERLEAGEKPKLYVCEGWATGWTIWHLTGDAVIVAFNCGNLKTVAVASAERYPDAELIIAADNDRWKRCHLGHNPGVMHARAAAEAASCAIVIPDFEGLLPKERPTDFNDLWQREGTEMALLWLDTAKASEAVIEAPPDPEPDEPPEGDDAGPTPPSSDSKPVSSDSTEGEEDADNAETTVPETEPRQTWLDTAGFRPIGYDTDRYYYLPLQKGTLASWTPAGHTKQACMSMAPLVWWERTFGGENGVSWNAATDALFQACHRAGFYRPERLRGRGCWLDDEGVVLHLGNKLLPPDADAYVQPETYHGADDHIYERRTRLYGPSNERALNSDQARNILDMFRDLLWIDESSGDLLAGWTVLAPISGALAWRPHLWLSGSPGAGKALPHSSKVLTTSGWRTMGDLKAGEYVRAPDGVPSRIIDVYPQGEIDVYELTFRDGRTARASADHLWKIRRSKKWKLCTTLDMADLLKSKQPQRVAIPLADPLEIKTDHGIAAKTKLPLHPYVLGAFLGDGCLSRSAPSLTSHDDHIVERVRDLLPEELSLSSHSCGRSFGLRGLNVYGRAIREAVKDLRTLGFSNTREGLHSWEKFIPRIYLDATVAERIELLKGLMDTDGTADKNGSMSYCTTSPRLRDDFVTLVRSLGGTAKVGVRHPHYTSTKGRRLAGREAYVIGVRLRDRTMAFSLPRKIERVSGDYQYGDTFYLQVMSIERVGKEECSCIRIDHPDSLYVTDNFVVTHNSEILKTLVMPLLGGEKSKGGMGAFYEAGSTEAGIRQELRADALPVVYDEAEKDQEGSKSDRVMQAVLALARSASSASGSSVVKGSAGGSAVSFQVWSMFLMSSVSSGLRQEQDKTRVSVLQLHGSASMSPHERAQHWKQYQPRLTAITTTMGRELIARTIGWLRDGRLSETLKVFKAAAAQVLGDSRSGDQYGTLYAGAWTLMSEDTPDMISAREIIGSGSIHSHLVDHLPEGRKVLEALLQASARLEFERGPARTLNVGELVDLVRPSNGTFSETVTVAREWLNRHGIKVEILSGSEVLLLANRSKWVESTLRDTPYGDAWREALRSVQGVDVGGPMMIFHSGLSSRVVIIPLRLLQPEEDDDDENGD